MSKMKLKWLKTKSFIFYLTYLEEKYINENYWSLNKKSKLIRPTFISLLSLSYLDLVLNNLQGWFTVKVQPTNQHTYRHWLSK